MANDNLFLLYKDSVVVETQLLLYGNQNLANAFVAAREKIIGTPNDKIIAEWTNIVEECRKQIYELKHDLYGAITEEYKTFAEKLKPPVVSASTDDAVKKIGSQLTQ